MPPEDKLAAPPEQPNTTKLDAVPAWAAEMGKNVTFIRGNVESLAGEFAILRIDVRSLQQWRLDEERRRLDAPVPPPPLTSIRVREVIDQHPSQMDLEQEAKLGAEIAARQQLEGQLAEERARRIALEEKAVTKEDLKAVTAAQTSALVEGFKLAAKNPTVQKLGWALAGLLFVAINVASTYLTSRAAAPPPTVITVPK